MTFLFFWWAAHALVMSAGIGVLVVRRVHRARVRHFHHCLADGRTLPRCGRDLLLEAVRTAPEVHPLAVLPVMRRLQESGWSALGGSGILRFALAHLDRSTAHLQAIVARYAFVIDNNIAASTAMRESPHFCLAALEEASAWYALPAVRADATLSAELLARFPNCEDADIEAIHTILRTEGFTLAEGCDRLLRQAVRYGIASTPRWPTLVLAARRELVLPFSASNVAELVLALAHPHLVARLIDAGASSPLADLDAAAAVLAPDLDRSGTGCTTSGAGVVTHAERY